MINERTIESAQTSSAIRKNAAPLPPLLNFQARLSDSHAVLSSATHAAIASEYPSARQ